MADAIAASQPGLAVDRRHDPATGDVEPRTVDAALIDLLNTTRMSPVSMVAMPTGCCGPAAPLRVVPAAAVGEAA